EQVAPLLHPVEIAVAVDVLEVCPLAAGDEERLVEADRLDGANRRVDAAGDEVERAAIELRAGLQRTPVPGTSRSTLATDSRKSGAWHRRSIATRRDPSSNTKGSNRRPRA